MFDKALGLYRQAMKLAPDNLVLATDYAMSYYGIRPLRTNDALVAWTNALNVARDDNEREGVMIHLARVKIAAGFYDQAQAQLDAITNAAYADMRDRLRRSLADHRNPPPDTSRENSMMRGLVSTNLAKTNGFAAMTSPSLMATNALPPSTNMPSLMAPPPTSLEQKQP